MDWKYGTNCLYCPMKKTCRIITGTEDCNIARDNYFNNLSNQDKTELIYEGFKRLATEIVATAVRDKARGTTLGHNGCICSLQDLSIIDEFFNSQYCYLLSGTDSTELNSYVEKLRGLNNGKKEKTDK